VAIGRRNHAASPEEGWMTKTVALAVLVVVISSGSALAQATATINGRVVDQAGAVLPGATVTVTNVGTGVVRSSVTNAEGLFSIPALDRGTYDIQAELEAFSASQKQGVELLTGSTLTVDFALTIAQLTETLTVQGQVPLVEVTQSAVSSSMRQTEVAQLPLANRSLAAMLTLMPGAREVPTSGAHGHAASYVSFGGGAGRNFAMLVDGAENKEDHDGGTTMVYSLEGVEEFKTLKSTFSAEYGKAATVVVLALKSGTNQLRGSVFGYGRNESLTTTDYFSKPENGGLGKQPFSRAQYGGSVGGPLLRDRLWYFGSIERVQQEFTLPRPDNLYQQLLILEDMNIGAVATRSISQPFRDLLGQVKVNAQLSPNHSAFVRYAIQDGYVDNNSVNTGRSQLPNGQRTDRNAQHMWNFSGGWTWIVSPRIVNQFTAQYLYYDHDNIYPECPNVVQGATVDWTPCLSQRLTFPSVSTGVANGFPHWHNWENKFEFRDDFSMQVGRHSLKFGVGYMPIPLYGGIFGGGSPGNITFFDDPSVIVNNTNGRYPRGFQTPGIVRSISVVSGTIGDYESERSWNFGTYVQDDFKLSSKITLNLGVRYDVYEYMNQPSLEKNRTYQVLKNIGSPYGQLPKTDTNNVSPRIGVAWDLRGDGRDVLRAGYGLFFGQGIMNSYFQQNFAARDIVYFPQTYTNTAIGSGALATYVYGVTPLPTAQVAPSEYPGGQSVTGYWYHPDLKDAVTHQASIGISHLFAQDTVFAVDYTHISGRNGWRTININPLLDHDDNPNTARVRPLAVDLQRVYGDRNLFGTVQLTSSLASSEYDEVIVRFERRFSASTALQTNYTLAWARGYGGSSDGTTEGGYLPPQTPSATGGDLYAPWEWGPTAYDERHRITVAGVFSLPFKIDVSPSFTAATARPYTQYRAQNPSGDGSLQILGPDGNPVGINQARGKALVNANARVTRNFTLMGTRRLSVFAEFYNFINRANFGNNYGPNEFAPATYNQPIGYLGGIASTSTIPISFQVQFGARLSF
jgi:hypothetical protein